MDALTLLLDAPDTPAHRIPIAKLGDYTDNRYGDFSITRQDIESWSKNLSSLPGGRALIDLDHRADRTPKNTEAAGWITGVTFDGDTPVADVEWTPVGEQAIRDKRYLFFSPTYGDHKDETGAVHENTLIGGALTNRPFLNMPALTLASDERVEQAKDAYGDEYRALTMLDVSAAERKLALKEGNSLPDGSYPIRNIGQLHAAAHLAATGHGNAAAAKKLIRRRAKELGVSLSSLPGFSGGSADSRRAMDTEVLTALDLAEGTDVNDVVAAINKLKADPEPTTVTLEQPPEGKILLDQEAYDRINTRLEQGEQAFKKLHERDFEDGFRAALDAGRVLPNERDSYKHFYSLDSEGTLKVLAERPQVVNTKPTAWDNGNTPNPEPTNLHEQTQAENRKVLEAMSGWGMDTSKDFIKGYERAIAEGIV